jgi:hypothetical protein
MSHLAARLLDAALIAGCLLFASGLIVMALLF